MAIIFGPAGLGGVKEAVSNLKKYAKLGLKACEIAFTYGIYIKENQKEEIKEIREIARKLDIRLSIHAPYWINLNSGEKKKIEDSKKRILDCCRIGERLGAYKVVFHPGYYGKMDEKETYENIKKAIIEMQKEIKKNKWKIEIAPETTGRVNVFGKEEDILNLVKETGCSFCLDFAHVLARNQGKIEYKEIYEKFRQFKSLHCHFSGIVWGSKGERSHKLTPQSELRKLIKILPKNKEIVIINESSNPVNDSARALDIYKKL